MDLSALLTRAQKLFNNRTVKYTVPFLIMVVGGSFALREFTRVRYDFTGTTSISRREFEKNNIEMKKPGSVTLESVYEEIKEINTDDWEQKRVPRPWEEESDSS